MSALVSIGIPVYNGEKTIRAAIESILKQSYKNLEIIISDNSSTDDTEKICREYQAVDSRILFFQQPKNLGLYANNAFVYSKAKGKYFSWAASDDYRSEDFIETNVEFLEANPHFVASTSPNCFFGNESRKVIYSISGSTKERLDSFFENCLISHGIFCSIIQTRALKNFPHFSRSYLALDWSVIYFLLCQGPIQRQNKGLLVFGVSGVSSGESAYSAFHSGSIEWVLPLLQFSLFVSKNSKQFSFENKILIFNYLVKLNFFFAKNKLISHLYKFYKKLLLVILYR
jgi:glycosyltransferase involved in cell wall biosynthesis